MEHHYLKIVQPTFTDYINGIVRVGSDALVLDQRSPSTVQNNMWTTTYATRHDPQGPLDTDSMIDALVNLFYSRYRLQDQRYVKIKFTFILKIFKYYGDLTPDSTLLPRSERLSSASFSMYDVKNKYQSISDFIQSAKEWTASNIAEDKLVQIELNIDEYKVSGK